MFFDGIAKILSTHYEPEAAAGRWQPRPGRDSE